MKKILATIFVFAFSFAAFGQNLLCPTVYITGPPSVLMPDENATFTVSIDGKAENLPLEYFWSVDKGKIIQGQGTRTVTIGEIPWDTTPTVTIEIKGLPEGCPNTASETSLSCHCVYPLLIAELKISAPQLDKMLFDGFIFELKNYPYATGYIIIYNDENTSTKKLKQKEQQIRKYLSDKNVPASMVVIVRARERKDLIRLFLVPQGAQPPTP